ncbi:alpha-amylase family glycosyl hydrolase [Coraliomargarita algicola]|uniref:Alpha-amylase family glycosyl hydrolase n=1 Tax=Coraliomargarita algicola TaxID=3092156 RepID=A0ABZ0RM05_9BACT|nr:alpha-amylase family glycosyl hydrolase [Coraliomargarita sp. J2-16]WPJ96128.1 alpha-amylase family glycosyl hydrolase [Coraliomargarita sp. J2-16]
MKIDEVTKPHLNKDFSSEVRPNQLVERFEFEGQYIAIEFASHSGNLIGIKRLNDDAYIYRDREGFGCRVCWGGDPVRPLTRGGSGAWVLLVENPPVDSIMLGVDMVYEGFKRTDTGNADEITIFQRDGDLRLATTYRLLKRLPVISFDFEVSNVGDGDVNIHFLDFPWGRWSFTNERCHWQTDKGNFQTQSLACGGSAVFWRDSDGDWWVWDILPEPQKSMNCKLLMGGRLRAKGDSMRGGGFHVGLSEKQGHGSADIARKWSMLRQLKPLPGAHWARSANIYETFIGYRNIVGIEMEPKPVRAEPYPTTEVLIEDLPRISELGYDVLYMMPRQPYPGYTTLSLTDAAAQYGDGPGTERAFQRLVDAAHAMGMRVIVDVVLHGGMDQASLRNQMMVSEQEGPGVLGTNYDLAHREYLLKTVPEEHPYWQSNPEWFSLINENECQMGYTRCFDMRHPGFQDYFAKSLASMLESYDLDGFRFDAPWWTPFAYRWTEEAGYRASWSVGASVELINNLYLETRKVKPDALFFMESSDPFTCQTAQMQYPYDVHRIVFVKMHRNEMNAREMREGLAYLRQIRLPGMRTAYWMVDSHDSVWANKSYEKWLVPYLGLPKTKACAVLMATLGDAIMSYTGSSDGMEDLFRQLLTLRQSVPVLAEGECDEIAVTCSHDDVFPVWRTYGSDWALPVISFSTKPVRVELELPIEGTDHIQLKDLLSPERVHPIEGRKIVLNLEPFDYCLIVPESSARCF